MRSLKIVAVALFFIANLVPAQAAREADSSIPPIYKSPQAVYEAYRAAYDRRDWRTVFSCFTPQARKDVVLSIYEYCSIYGLTPEVAAMRRKHFVATKEFLSEEYKAQHKAKHTNREHPDTDLYAEILWSKTVEPASLFESWRKLPREVGDLEPLNPLEDLRIGGEVANGKVLDSPQWSRFFYIVWGNPPRRVAGEYSTVEFEKVNGSWLISSD